MKLVKKLAFTKLSAGTFRHLMALYPPLLLNRIYARKMSKDFRYAEVIIKKSFLNKNPNGSIFGGTLACAADPWIGAMYWQILTRRNIKARIWVRAAEYDYLKPADTNLTMEIVIPREEIEEVGTKLKQGEKVVKIYHLEMKNTRKEVCCKVKLVMVMYPREKETEILKNRE